MEVNARIADIAMQNGIRPEEMRNRLAQQGQLQQIQAVVQEEKAADQLVAACTVTEMPVDEWKEQETGEKTSSKKKNTKKKTSKKTAKKTATKKKTKKKTTKKTSTKS
jgi:hypothetical protein